MIRKAGWMGLVAAASMVGSPIFADDKGEKMAVNDTLFAQAAADSGMAEVALSEMALSKVSCPELKKFSEQMVEDHSKVNKQLKELAAKQGVTLPSATSAGQQFCAQSLAGLSGEEFDHHYAHAQLIGHMMAVATFEAEAERGRDEEMRSFAKKTLPKLKEHLHEIRQIAMKHEKDHKHDEK